MESTELTNKATHKTPNVKLTNTSLKYTVKPMAHVNTSMHQLESKVQTAGIEGVNPSGGFTSSSSRSFSLNSNEELKKRSFDRNTHNVKTEPEQLVLTDNSKSECSLSGQRQREKHSNQKKTETKATARNKPNLSNDTDGEDSPSGDNSNELRQFMENAQNGNDVTTSNSRHTDREVEDRDKVAECNSAAVRLPNWKDLAELDSLPLVRSGYSIEADMKFGWKPTVKGKVLPIPFIFDSQDHYFDLDHHDPRTKEPLPTIFLGFRPRDSFKLYRQLQQNVHPYHGSQIKLKLPTKLPPQIEKLLDQQMQNQLFGGAVDLIAEPRVVGMQPSQQGLTSQPNVLHFDSLFECGNLDRAVMVNPNEYDLYMRPDTNTRGHHQWFYFRTIAKQNLGPVKFNILNFTKNSSLHEVGMKICICSAHEKSGLLKQATHKQVGMPPTKNEDLGWKRGGYNISYDSSKLNDIIKKNNGQDYDDETSSTNNRVFYQLSFTYDYDLMDGDEVYFAQSFPYTFTRLNNYIKELKANNEVMKHLKDSTPICNSLSGLDIPYLIVTSRVNEDNFNEIDQNEHSKQNCPPDKFKKTIVITGRVHPGETNASFMMEGFINFITSPKNEVAKELRKRIVFKIVPCVNPDGVIAGNYRVSMSGNDLNRRFKTPHPKLHPVVCAIKKMISDESGPNVLNQDENKKVIAFIDLHGHSRKKSVFMYGPDFPIHDTRYMKMKIIPKIMSEHGDMFRFYSCKFRFEKSKEKTARIVIWKEFNITSCYTLEASMMGYFDHQRETRQFIQSHFYQVGKMLVESIFEFVLIREDERRQIKARLELQKQKEEMQKVMLKVPNNSSPRKQDSCNNVIKKVRQLSTRNILSPSASSDAMILPDQEQSDRSNELSFSLKKRANEKSNTKDKKKIFKVIKKYKDDPVIKDPPKAEKEVANPNEPEEGQNESSSPRAAHDFISQFQQQKKTYQDLCNEIENDDKQDSSEENPIDTIKYQGSNQRKSEDEKSSSPQRRQRKGQKRPYKSDNESDSDNNDMMKKIHQNIIGLINATEPQKEPIKKVSTKTTVEKKPQRIQVTRVASGKKNTQATKKLEEKKITVLPKAKKMINTEYTSTTDVLKSENKPKNNKSQIRRTESKLHQPPQRKSKMADMETKKQVYQNVTPAVVYPAQGIPMNCNNFNDRIMNEQYSKHKTQYNHGPVYQLNTLSTGAQKLLSKHLANDQLRRMQMIEQQNQRAIQKEKEKNFSIYNFHSKKVEKHNLNELNMSIGNLSSGRRSLERQYQRPTQDEFFEQTHQRILDKLNEGSPSRYQIEPFFSQTQSPTAANMQINPSRANDHTNSSESMRQFNKFVGMGNSQKVQKSANYTNNAILQHAHSLTSGGNYSVNAQSLATGQIQIQSNAANIGSPLKMKVEFPLQNEMLSVAQNSRNRSTEYDQHAQQVLIASQNQRNRRLKPVDQNSTLNNIQPVLSKSPDYKPRQAQKTLGSTFFELQNEQRIGPIPASINEELVEESPNVGGNELLKIAKSVNFRINEKPVPIDEQILRENESQPTPVDEDFRTEMTQDIIFAQRGLSTYQNDSRQTDKQNQFKQLNFEQQAANALYASMDMNRNSVELQQQVQQDYYQQPKAQVIYGNRQGNKSPPQQSSIHGTKSPPEQTTIEMSTSHRLKYNILSGQKQVKSTIYMTEQKPIQNIIQLLDGQTQQQESQTPLIRGMTTAYPDSRKNFVNSNPHQSETCSPQSSLSTSPMKVKRQNIKQPQKSKNNDYQQMNSPGMQTIKSHLLAQSEQAKLKQKQQKKSQRSDMIYNSIKNQKFQSLLNQQDFQNMQQEKSTNLIQDKMINNQEQQIQQQVQQIPPNTVNLKTNKTIHFVPRAQINAVTNRQQQQQNQYIYQQKLSNVNKSKQLQPSQYYPHQYQQQQPMQMSNQQKLQRNVYNDLQELQRELNQMEPPMKNIKSYSEQFKNHPKTQLVSHQASFSMQKSINSHQRNNQMIKIQDRAFQSQDNNILSQMISHQNLMQPGVITETSPGVRFDEGQTNFGSPGRSQVKGMKDIQIRQPRSHKKQSETLLQNHHYAHQIRGQDNKQN